jgi:hypothetical protein
MKAVLQEILSIDGVRGVLFFSRSGKALFQAFNEKTPEGINDINWPLVVKRLSKIAEGDLAFERQRIYVRQSELGCLIVSMEWDATIAMVRLKSDAVFSL